MKPTDTAEFIGELYSVGQLSCLVADLVPEGDKLITLLQDGTETYAGDMVRPLKQWMAAYQHVVTLEAHT
jgi:hypothetical protein